MKGWIANSLKPMLMQLREGTADLDPFEISSVRSREILDSRGNPTVETVIVSKSGDKGVARVPSGASTGKHEALELRDNDQSRYGGKGVLKAVSNVNAVIAPSIIGKSCNAQEEIDSIMIGLDGTENKSRLGANAILSASIACCVCASEVGKRPLYAQLAESGSYKLPVPMMNVINGGRHAGNMLSIQEFIIEPFGAGSFAEALRMGSEVYHKLKEVLKERYGPSAINVGDEGGFAPPLKRTADALDSVMKAIRDAGYDESAVSIGIDAAASNFFDSSRGVYSIDEKELTSAALLDYYEGLANSYPIKTIEDPFQEEAFEDFASITSLMGSKVKIIGDDIYVTNKHRILKGIRARATNAVLIKPNQIGTITETIGAISLCKREGLCYTVSHRSGETEDTFISHLAVAFSSDFIKAGAPARGERIIKYNELLRIEEELGARGHFRNFDV